MVFAILAIIANVVYFVVMNRSLYTDRAIMGNGEVREWHRSPIDRLNISGHSWLLYLELALMVMSIITGILLLFGVKSSLVKTIQLASTIASTVLFIVIMIVTSDAHVSYA